jgi:hypothetical protein
VFRHIEAIVRERVVKAANGGNKLVGGRPLLRPNMLEPPYLQGVDLFILRPQYMGALGRFRAYTLYSLDF